MTRIRAKDKQMMEEQAQAQLEMMNAKIMEAAEHQHVSVAAACKKTKPVKGVKKAPQQTKWVKKGEKPVEKVVVAFQPKYEEVSVV